MTTARFETSQGTFTVRLMPEHAPITVANFVDLATGSGNGRTPATANERASLSTTGRSSTASSQTS